MIVNEGGKKLPKLTAPGTEDDLLFGKQLIDQHGNVVDGQIMRMSGATIVPSTYEKTAISGGRYAYDDIKVAGDADLISKNIKFGVNIFGVSGDLIDPEKIGRVKIESVSSGANHQQFQFTFPHNAYADDWIPQTEDEFGTALIGIARRSSSNDIVTGYIYLNGLNDYIIACDGEIATSGATINFTYDGDVVLDSVLCTRVSVSVRHSILKLIYSHEEIGVYIPKERG